MTPTPYPDLNDVLARLASGAQMVLGGDFVGAYLQGSFAVGDAEEGSDVDFLVVTRELLTPDQERQVQDLQRALFDLSSPWARHLEGSYFPADLLRPPDPSRTPLPYFDNGSRDLQHSDHDNTLVVRWVTRKHGVTLAGPPPKELIDPVSADDLRAEVRETLREWGAALLADPDGLNNGWRQPYVALSYARMLHTLDTGAVHSKKAAVDWARDQLDARWSPLLERAWAQHRGQFARVGQPADPTDLALTQDFIRFALEGTPHAADPR